MKIASHNKLKYFQLPSRERYYEKAKNLDNKFEETFKIKSN